VRRTTSRTAISRPPTETVMMKTISRFETPEAQLSYDVERSQRETSRVHRFA
jgi:hypothetical protein